MTDTQLRRMEPIKVNRKNVRSPKKRSSPKRKMMKLTKKSLDSLSLKKLQKLAVKYKVSIFKKGAKKTKKNLIKKSTLLKRMKKNRSINKILLSAHKMKYSKTKSAVTKKSSKFGQRVQDMSYRTTVMTPAQQLAHYNKIPKSLLSYNFVNGVYLPKTPYGTSSLPSMKYGKKVKFGQYFH